MDNLLTSSGDGYGYGSGHGDGDGYGYGYGDGDGYGYGYGDGYGFGFGDRALFLRKIGKVEDNDVCISPWGLVHVGCQSHSIEHWRKNWEEIAEDNDVEIGRDEVLRMIDAARRIIKG